MKTHYYDIILFKNCDLSIHVTRLHYKTCINRVLLKIDIYEF